MTAEQRNQLSIYWRNVLLANMLYAQAAGETSRLEIPVIGDRYVPLIPGATAIVRLDRLQDHRADIMYWQKYRGISFRSTLGTIRNITGEINYGGLTLIVDQPGYGPTTDVTVGVRMYPTLFIRALFSGEAYLSGYYDPNGNQLLNADYSHGVMVALCPAWSMPSMYDFGVYATPSLFGNYQMFVGATTNVCAITFQTR